MPSLAEVPDPNSLADFSGWDREGGIGLLRFSDGEEFDTGGELRTEARRDGL